jgi:hypothetical protein
MALLSNRFATVGHDGCMSPHPEMPSKLVELLAAEPSPQGSFPWNRDPWREQMHDLADVLTVLDMLPDRVDRHTTRNIVLSELEAGRVLPAFVSAMIWGYGTTGFGPVRTRWILTGVGDSRALQAPVLSSVSERLEAGTLAARQLGPLKAFQIMNNAGRVKHLRSAYFTKWLYFTSALQGPDDPTAAPIIDSKVASWLREHAEVSLDVNLTASYSDYLNLLADWGHLHGRSRVQIEKAIFGLATGRG